jgi:hypothetical protein
VGFLTIGKEEGRENEIIWKGKEEEELQDVRKG